jgi:hypothetical protein
MAKKLFPESVQGAIQEITDRTRSLAYHEISADDAEAAGRYYYQFWDGAHGDSLAHQCHRIRTCGRRREQVFRDFRKWFPALEVPEPAEAVWVNPPEIETESQDQAENNNENENAEDEQQRPARRKPRK